MARVSAPSDDDDHDATTVTSRGSRSDRPDESAEGERRRRRISPLTLVGTVLLAAGLGCLGWVGFQYFGTDVIARQSFQNDRRDVRQQWAQPPVEPTARTEASAAPTSPISGEVMALLRIPAFGANYEVPVLEGTDLSVLARGVGHYQETALPGEVGNFAIAGHRVTHGSPFGRLLELRAGDKVVVETRTAIYTYVIDAPPRQLTVQDTDSWVIDPVPGQPDAKPTEALLTLTTCQDLFRSPDRSVGFGHLASTQNKDR